MQFICDNNIPFIIYRAVKHWCLFPHCHMIFRSSRLLMIKVVWMWADVSFFPTSLRKICKNPQSDCRTCSVSGVFSWLSSRRGKRGDIFNSMSVHDSRRINNREKAVGVRIAGLSVSEISVFLISMHCRVYTK